ncbi:MAG: hypothetical protein AB8B73_01960 [Ekhidna sp.]
MSTQAILAQRFSEDKAEFRTQVLSKLKGMGSESGHKIAYDFQNAWNGKFTAAQQDKIHQIALTMQKKGFKFYPSFYHYFSYLTYSVTQESLQRNELDSVLLINEQVIQTLSKREYQEFIFGLNIFFARRYLSFDKNLSVMASEGTYGFKLLDEFIPVQEEEYVEDTSSFITEEQIAAIEENTEDAFAGEADDPWNTSSDPWADDTSDPWDTSNDPWADNSNDPWDTASDPWDSSPSNDDPWANDTTWDDEPEEEYVAPKPQRPSYAPLIYDRLAEKQNKYISPALQGPAIELKNTRMLVTTPYDSMKIKNVDGTFLLKNRTFVGTKGSIDWPPLNNKFRGAIVQVTDFKLRKDRSDFWTPHAKLSFDKLVNGEIEGIFEFKSKARPKRKLNQFPIFTSNEANVSVKLPDEKLSYLGGIRLQGNKLYGASASEEMGTLKVLDGKGNTIVLKSKFFVLGDSLVSMDHGSIAILHGSDSIYHSSVRAKFDTRTRQLTILRNSTLTPFHSSYFDITMDVDLIKWNTELDSITMEIMNGKDLLPATFESEDFFDVIRYKKLARFLDFHPINLTVFYAKKYGLTQFYVGELAEEFKINENFAKAAGKLLMQYGFAEYENGSGLLKLNKKAFHYYDASAKKVDFDNLMIPSKIKNGSNAYIKLDSGQLKVRGVSRFYLTTDFKIYGAPNDSTVTLLKGRNIEFDGMVHAGDFQYKGQGHQFDYEEFLFNMPVIDSMRITVPLRDSTAVDSDFETTTLQNEIAETSGTLYLNDRDNKSGKNENKSYPYFISDSEAVVYFDGSAILDGAYDKSVKFIIPPFEIDSLEREDGESIEFEGVFNSGGIFPTFDETLHVQEDKSLGFIHNIPPEGYHLYGTDAKTYEEVRLSNKGMRGFGQIDFLTTTIYSDDFIYYPDSVTTDGTSGVISPQELNGASFPEAILGKYDMYWLPKKDSMYLRTVDEPFKFYNSTAQLQGYANITTKGVYGGGTMLSRGSKSISNELSFKQFEYDARHADFQILSNDLEKPAMAGDDIRLEFDLTDNTATIRPERIGIAAISFPYAQMKTSITEAIWDLEDSIVTMTKPDAIALKDSYFFTTREDLDSLAFTGEKAIYDINSRELNVQGIPYIIVADSKIIPEGNETTILANSVLQKFENAEIIIDTLNGYHYLDRASIRIFSRNKFEGNAFYKQVVGKDTFDIRFDSFELKEVPVGKANRKGDQKTRLMTVSGGEVLENQNLIISSGFLYKGSVTMYASKPALELDGHTKIMLSDPTYNQWVQFQRKEGEREVQLPFDNALFEDGTEAVAGLHFNIRDEMYTTFVEPKAAPSDLDFFKASGILSYSEDTQFFRIETPSKTLGESYQGSTLIYSDSAKSIIFEGDANFLSATNTQVSVKSSLLGTGNKETNEYTVDAMMSFDFQAPTSAMEIMAEDLLDIIERVGPSLANDLSIEFLYKLANFTDEATTRYYEETSLKDYISLVSSSQDLERPIVVSGVKMNWNKERKAWHNTTKLALSNIFENDLNAKLDGFLEITKDESGADVVNLFIQAAPGVWYYIGYTYNQLVMFSSNSEFNEVITGKSNVGKSKPGEKILALGTENETLTFINAFRLNYFGINEPYNLVLPGDASLEDENFDTIEEDDDEDGFGFE